MFVCLAPAGGASATLPVRMSRRLSGVAGWRSSDVLAGGQCDRPIAMIELPVLRVALVLKTTRSLLITLSTRVPGEDLVWEKVPSFHLGVYPGDSAGAPPTVVRATDAL